MIIRQATPNDAPTLSALAKETYAAAFGHSMSPSDLVAHLENNLGVQQFKQMLAQDTIFVADVDGQMVGFVQWGSAGVATEFVSPTDQELRRLYVLAPFQQQGVGTRLLEAALDHPSMRSAERVVLDVWEQNGGAGRLYERYGFVVVGARAFAVASGAATSQDLIMVRRKVS